VNFGDSDTIFSVASGGARAAVTLMRISGRRAGTVIDCLCRKRPAPRRASVRMLRNRKLQPLDKAVVLWLPGPASYTGEDCAELHLHGGAAVLNDVCDALVAEGLRPAEAGEFTRRAFMNGRLDLVEAEAVADLVDSETSSQRIQALGQLEGSLSRLLEGWKEQLTTLLSQQEALIDFPDEGLPHEVEEALVEQLEQLRGAMAQHLDDDRRGERLRDGLVFAVAGAPNAGKSTLINALAGRDVAIVSPIPGTTRDVLEARVVLGGVPVTLLDTAGLRDTDDPVEAEGIRRARHRAACADLVLLVGNEAEPWPTPPEGVRSLTIGTKSDIASPATGTLAVSALTNEGMPDLVARLAETAQSLTQSKGPAPLTRPRHRAALGDATNCLAAALAAPAPELRAEDMRMALRALGRITGHVGVEEILDSIFGQFCIGK
jgi:tRNA modification GTPase